MGQKQKSGAITKSRSRWLWAWDEPESVLNVIPRSKTARLAQKAKLANVDAEKAIGRTYQIEIARTKIVGEAMFKIGKALRYTLASSARQIFLRTEAARRRFEPKYPSE